MRRLQNTVSRLKTSDGAQSCLVKAVCELRRLGHRNALNFADLILRISILARQVWLEQIEEGLRS